MHSTGVLIFLLSSLYMGLTGYAQENQDKLNLSLKDAIIIANENNPEIISALKEIDAAGGRILQAGRLQNAELSLELNEIPRRFAFDETGEIDFNFIQPLELFGKRNARIQYAGVNKSIATFNYHRTKKLITSQIKKAYYSGLLSDQVIANIKANINLLNDFLAQVTDRYQAGTSGYLDIIRAKVEISRLKNELYDAMKDYQRHIGELKNLLGKEDGNEYELTDSLNYRFSEMDKNSLVDSLSSQSYYLDMTGIQVERNKSLLTLAEKNSLPDFNFGFALQYRQSQLSPGFDHYFGLNAGISLPMFYSSGVKGDIQEAEANLSISDTRYQSAKIRVSRNITTAFNTLSFAEEQLRLFDTSLLRDVEDELRAGITAYQNNQIDLLNLFDIYRTYRLTRVEYSRTIYNALEAFIDLEVSSEVINE